MSARELAKQAVLGLATVAVAPALVSFHLRALFVGRDRALEGSTQAFALVPGLTGQYLRRAFLRHALAACHPTATIEFGTIFSSASARLEAHIYIGPRCHIGLVHIERDVLIAAGVHIPSGAHIHGAGESDLPFRIRPLTRRQVRIGAGSWVGSASVVMADVGANTIVGAGAVVTKPLPDNVVAGGVPARVIAERRPGEARA